MFQYRKVASESEDPLSIGALRASGSEGNFNFRIALFAAIDGAGRDVPQLPST